MILVLIGIVSPISYFYLTQIDESHDKTQIQNAIEIVTCVIAAVILYGIYRTIPILDDNFFSTTALKIEEPIKPQPIILILLNIKYFLHFRN